MDNFSLKFIVKELQAVKIKQFYDIAETLSLPGEPSIMQGLSNV